MTDIEAPNSTAYHNPDAATATTSNSLFGSPHVFTAKRVFIAIMGIFLGFITMLPNAMMGASSAFAAHVGILASISFGIGGLYGGYVGEFKWLLPAFGLQVVALLYFDTSGP